MLDCLFSSLFDLCDVQGKWTEGYTRMTAAWDAHARRLIKFRALLDAAAKLGAVAFEMIETGEFVCVV